MTDRLVVTLDESDKNNPKLIVTRRGWIGVYNVVTENAEYIYELLIGKHEKEGVE